MDSINMIKCFFGLIIMLLISMPAKAGGCYTLSEAEAEQGIRIQSELMVIGLNCQHKIDDIYVKYRQMANSNSQLFETYNKIMMDHFKKSGISNFEKEINSMRTSYANKISEIAAELRPDVFCSKYAPRIERASIMKRDEIRRWATTFFPSHPVSKPICES